MAITKAGGPGAHGLQEKHHNKEPHPLATAREGPLKARRPSTAKSKINKFLKIKSVYGLGLEPRIQPFPYMSSR